MKELKFICSQPDDIYYTWQVHMWLESLQEIGHSDKAIVLIFTPNYREKSDKWKKIEDLYPETEFYYYKDEDDISSLLGVYIPVLRPYVLWKHFKSHPELMDKALFYCDSDILFTEKFNIDGLIEDDVCYLSDTNSYINSTYFDSKEKDVLPEKLEEYKSRDILAEVTSIIGISREIAEANKEHSGGAQYLLKNIDYKFWSKVMNDSILIRTYLQKINREFFESENKGFQSWCADMWAVLWNLWLRDKKTIVTDELKFAWAPDPIEKLETHTIFHNAGITGSFMETGSPSIKILDNGSKLTVRRGYDAFYKGKYHEGSDPTKDEHLDKVLNNKESKKKCTWYYANHLYKVKNKYNLNY